jgi:hypothetical protein
MLPVEVHRNQMGHSVVIPSDIGLRTSRNFDRRLVGQGSDVQDSCSDSRLNPYLSSIHDVLGLTDNILDGRPIVNRL